MAAGLNALPFDPASHNDSLQFNNTNKPLVTECPSLENTAENGKKRKRTSLPPGLSPVSVGSSSSLWTTD
ncbi:hypothetical protein PAMA_017127 [Pampus argenteus]